MDDAQRKRRVDAAALACDGADWPRPIVAIPIEYGAGAVAPAGGCTAAAPSVLDGGGGVFRRNDVVAVAAASATGESSLAAAAAAGGRDLIPVDIGLREAELLNILLPPGLVPPSSSVEVSDGGGGDGGGANAIIRSWLRCEVVASEPGLLLLPSAQLAATVEALCAWLGVPAGALSYYILPYRLGSLLKRGERFVTDTQGTALAAWQAAIATQMDLSPPVSKEVGTTCSACGGSRALPRDHVVLLTRRSDILQRAGNLICDWLGGCDIESGISGSDVIAVIRTLPGLLYDRSTMCTVAHVLHALLGGGTNAEPADDDNDKNKGEEVEEVVERNQSIEAYGGGYTGTDRGGGCGESDFPGMPAWVLVTPPDDDHMHPGYVTGHVTEQGTHGSVPSMPSAAVALLLQFPGEVHSEGIQELLDAGPATATPSLSASSAAAADSSANELVSISHNGCGIGGRDAISAAIASDRYRGSRLNRAVRLLSDLLGIGRLAAAALILATHGSAALIAVELPPAATTSIRQVRSLLWNWERVWSHRSGTLRTSMESFCEPCYTARAMTRLATYLVAQLYVRYEGTASWGW